jgi:serine protease
VSAFSQFTDKLYENIQRAMSTRNLATITTILASLLVVGCGGGGGGGGGNRAPITPANLAPNAIFSTTPSQGSVPLPVQFNASASTDSDGTIRSYLWDFGQPADGSSTSGATTSHTYAVAGSYDISLQITDNDGATASTSRTVTVTAPVPAPVPVPVPVNQALASISGNIRVLSSSAIDSDVNDIGSQPTANNDFASAQTLPNPATLGGFINEPMTGVGDVPERGNLYSTGDPGDFYAVAMAGNEVIILDIADPASAAQALYLYDSTQSLIDMDDSTQGTQRVQVPAPDQVPVPGTYYIEVRPISGASNYILTVGQDLLSGSTSLPRLSDDFVPGEILLSTDFASLSGDFGLTEVAHSGAVALMRIDDAEVTLSRLGRSSPFDGRWGQALRTKYATRAMIEALTRDPRTRVVEPNYLRHAHAEPNDVFYGLQWHYPAINLPLAWDITSSDASVIVAVVDTGVLLTHPDLDSQLVAGFDFIADPTRARDGDGRDNDPTDEGDLAFGGSSSFHGTHVAGTIAAESDTDPNNPSPGVAGVAWNARLMPLRALGVDGGTSFDVIEAVKWAAGLSNVSNTLPTEPADIINLSLGGSTFSVCEQLAINEVTAAGVIVVASAGNDSSTLPSYPAAYDGVISVSATTIQNNAIAPYSNGGPTIDISAPGGSNISDINGDGIIDGVISTLADDSDPLNLEFGYAPLQGTSMAAPHVAGVIALMKAVHPMLTPAEFDNALLAGELTDDLGATGRDDQYGYGLINAHKAVLAALALAAGQGVDLGPILSLSASALVFGSAPITTEQQTLVLSNVGTGVVNLQNISTTVGADWLDVSEISVDANTGMGSYAVTVDRSGLVDGSYNATIDIATDATNPTVNVTMRVVSGSPNADAGVHYVILVDDNGDTVANVVDVVNINNGEYRYTLNAVPTGEFRVFAGTDSDDDALLCDAGEACGAYGTLDSPETLTVDGVDLDNIDFTSEFRVNLNSSSTTSTTNSSASPTPATPMLIRKPSP